MDKLVKTGEASTDVTALVQLGPGLSALPRRLVAKIEADEYIDFNELPPARGKGRSVSQPVDGQVVVVQAADLVQSRRLMPDLATWVQCFGLYAAVVVRQKPDRLAELLAYQASIAKASQKYRWPAWLIYDQNFRMEAAGNSQSWARVEPGLYAQCFTGQARTMENWCATCQGLDHSSARCPYRSQKRPWSAAFGHVQAGRAPVASGAAGHCIKYNRFNGDCKFGAKCKFPHVCSGCGGHHPVSQCSKGDTHAE